MGTLLLALLWATGAVVEAGPTEPPRFAGRNPFDLLGSHRVELGEDGAPLVTVGIARDQDEVAIRFPGGAILHLPDGRRQDVPPGARLRFSVRHGTPAQLFHHVQVEQIPFEDREGLVRARVRWEAQGHRVRTKVLGAAFAIAGHMVDTRRHAILLEGGSREEAEAILAKLGGPAPMREIFEEVVRPAAGRIEVRDEEDRVIASAEAAVYLEPLGTARVEAVEHDMGHAAHGREDRTYGGGLFVTVDAGGRTAVVNLLRLEDLLRGIVPAEIFAAAPSAALRAQAVAARGEVLAKIGARHLSDPFHLCAEQHCQVYKGLGAEHPRTNAAVRETAGLLLFGPDGKLVDTVYSSTCGGHTENNEAVWGTPPSPHLRGRPDIWWEGDLPPVGADLEARLESDEEAMCASSSFARPKKFRWTREFSDAALAERVAPLGVGEVVQMEVRERGVSGRATVLRIVGTRGAAEVRGELAIRRLLGNLNSSLFVVDRLLGRWRLRGAGWGHGVGMCQMGAIGRAERGADHVAILRHYYPGAELRKLY